MTKEQIREKAFEFVSERASGTVKEMDYYANILTEFATEVTKELQKENAELKTKVSEQSERISELTQELDDEINRFG